MLELFFTVAFSAVPLILYIPPVRSLNLFVETMEDIWRQSSVYTGRIYPRLRYACGLLAFDMPQALRELKLLVLIKNLQMAYSDQRIYADYVLTANGYGFWYLLFFLMMMTLRVGLPFYFLKFGLKNERGQT